MTICNMVLNLLYICPQMSRETEMVISLSFGSGVFSTTSLNSPVPDLFGSNSADDGVEHGRYQEIENSQHDMYHSGHLICKLVGEESKESRDIKSQDDLGGTCAKGFELGFI